MDPIPPQLIATAPDVDAIRAGVDERAIQARLRDLEKEAELLRQLLGVVTLIDGRRSAKEHYRRATRSPEAAHAAGR